MVKAGTLGSIPAFDWTAAEREEMGPTAGLVRESAVRADAGMREGPGRYESATRTMEPPYLTVTVYP